MNETTDLLIKKSADALTRLSTKPEMLGNLEALIRTQPWLTLASAALLLDQEGSAALHYTWLTRDEWQQRQHQPSSHGFPGLMAEKGNIKSILLYPRPHHLYLQPAKRTSKKWKATELSKYVKKASPVQ